MVTRKTINYLDLVSDTARSYAERGQHAKAAKYIIDTAKSYLKGDIHSPLIFETAIDILIEGRSALGSGHKALDYRLEKERAKILNEAGQDIKTHYDKAMRLLKAAEKGGLNVHGRLVGDGVSKSANYISLIDLTHLPFGLKQIATDYRAEIEEKFDKLVRSTPIESVKDRPTEKKKQHALAK